MIGEKIKALRSENALTQKDLAEKLYVTAQAVSRWENNEVEPSITTLTAMAKIFNISVSELIGEEPQQTKENVEISEYIVTKQDTKAEVLAVCECCNEPIYKGVDIVRKTEFDGEVSYKKVICKACDKKQRDKEFNTKIFNGKNQRRKSFVWGGFFSALITLLILISMISAKEPVGSVITGAVVGLTFFPFLSCLYLKNNFIDDVFLNVASWSVRFPGLIFTLDLDGIIWFLTVKLIFGVLSCLLAIFCFFLALGLGLFLSIFVYPFAIVKSFRYPELTEL